jgi:hypothetical protein
MRSQLVLAALAVVTLSGCLSGDEAGTDDAIVVPPNLLDPVTHAVTQFESHPAYGFPTSVDYTGFKGTEVPSSWVPPAAVEIPDTITGIKSVARAEGVASGAGIAVFGHYAIVSGNGPGSIVDVADPLNPVKVADLEISVRDADIIAYPDGRLVAVMASDGFVHVFDITDPTKPVPLPDLESQSHNAGVVPGTPIVYNANSAGGGINAGSYITGHGNGKTEIYDLSDPDAPVKVGDFANGYGCHDITFYINAAEEKYRAYCAGIEVTQIWDITNPLEPVVLTTIPVHHGVPGTPSASVPLVLFSHLAMVNHDASILIVGDETGGGLVPPGCLAHAQAGPASASDPLGNLWFYDISDETSPVLKGSLSPTYPVENPTARSPLPPSCTAHFGRIIGERDLAAVAFYNAGVVIVDFSDPMFPKIVAQWNEGTDTWDVWFWQGRLYTGDLARGLDILELV